MENQVKSQNSKRIAKNTIVLYFRMIFMMLVSLYTSRIIINALGFEDYGIYSAVGGFVAMFGVISNSLTAAVSRFITFSIGAGDSEKLNRVFASSIIIQLIIAGIVLILLETIGLWFLNYHMVIPNERLVPANFVLQFSIITFLVQLISVPYNASIIAHERMTAFALISILNAMLNLCVAFLVKYSQNYDKLILYSMVLAIVAIFIRLLYGWYCGRNFSECKFRFIYDKKLLSKIVSFAGWNFFGASSAVLRDQGINVLLNVFCGPIVNAARGIAMQVSSAISSFSSSFLTALNPQITKQYAAGDMHYVFNLCFKGSRLGFFLLLLLSLPIFMETEQILSLWLGKIPPHTVNFVRLIVVYVMVESVSSTLITLMLATGNIKKYQIIVGGTQLLNFPIAFIVLKAGFIPEYTMIATILIAIMCLTARLFMLRKMVGLPIRLFIKEVIAKSAIVTLIALILPLCVVSILDMTLLRLLITGGICVISTTLSVLFLGCTYSERHLIINKIISRCPSFLR